MGSDDQAIGKQQIEPDAGDKGERRGPARLGTDAGRGAQLSCAVPWIKDAKLAGHNSVAIDVEANRA